MSIKNNVTVKDELDIIVQLLPDRYRFLCSALSEEKILRNELFTIWNQIGDEAAWKVAVENRVESVVASSLGKEVGESNLNERWRNAISDWRRRVSLLMSEMDKIGDAAFGVGERIIALKNGGIARALIEFPERCPMGDIDLLVRKGAFPAIDSIMLNLGYSRTGHRYEETIDSKEAFQEGGCEYLKHIDGEDIWVEIQWRPVAGRWVRPDQEPNSSELIDKSVPISGSRVRLLSPEDNLFQVCLHTAKHTFLRDPGFRLHTDVDRIVRHYSINWDVFLGLVQKYKVTTPVYFSLRIANAFLNSPIPSSIWKSLSLAKWKKRRIIKWLNKAGFFNPNEKKFSNLKYLCLNGLMYDSPAGLFRAAFPEPSWMIQRYMLCTRWRLPYAYIKRLLDFAVKRRGI